MARQYCGSVGKVENGQVGVFVGYSGPKGYGLISAQLFMPEKWFGEDYKQLRKECAVPDDLTFKTKPQIALDLIHKMKQFGLFKAKWMGVDCLYGNRKEFKVVQDYSDFMKTMVLYMLFPKRFFTDKELNVRRFRCLKEYLTK